MLALRHCSRSAITNGGVYGKIIFLTVHGDSDYVLAAVSAGAQGFVLKSRLASDLLLGLREVLAGRRYVSPNLSLANQDWE